MGLERYADSEKTRELYVIQWVKERLCLQDQCTLHSQKV